MLNAKWFLIFVLTGSPIWTMEAPDELTEAFNKTSSEAALKKFNKALGLFGKDTSKPLISHLVKTNKTMWEALMILGFKESKFTSQDLFWVVSEYSSPQNISSKKSEALFKLMIIDNANHKVRKPQVANLLENVSLKKQGWFQNSDLLNPQSKNEEHNVLAECIERKFVKAFSEILRAFPEFVKSATSKISIKRSERRMVDQGYVWNQYEYSDASYSLVGWLMRSHEGAAHLYLDEKQHRQLHYVESAQSIIRLALGQVPENAIEGQEDLAQNSEQVKDIPEALFDMISVLKAQGDVTREELNQAAFRLQKANETR